MVEDRLLQILVCPETKRTLVEASSDLVAQLNERIKSESLTNRSNQVVTETIESGLVAQENPDFLYPIRNGIPVMLIDEAIPLECL